MNHNEGAYVYSLREEPLISDMLIGKRMLSPHDYLTFLIVWDDQCYRFGRCLIVENGKVIRVQDKQGQEWPVHDYQTVNNDSGTAMDVVLAWHGLDENMHQDYVSVGRMNGNEY